MSEHGAGGTDRLSVDDIAALLRGAADVAPASVTERVVARVRVESTALTLLRTLGGAWLRVARAVPDLATRPVPGSAHDLEDTGEFPAPDA